LTDQPLPIAEASAWAVLARCGAVVTFSGTARDHSEGRPDVARLEYEAYEEQVVPRLAAIAAEARTRWPELGRVALLHRVGEVPIGEAAVVVVVSAPHREAAFEAARFGIDTLKATVPIWKREAWAGGRSWGLEPQTVTSVPSADATETVNLQSRSTGVSG
jgi:molybdopterin synthase catalytic subunit